MKVSNNTNVNQYPDNQVQPLSTKEKLIFALGIIVAAGAITAAFCGVLSISPHFPTDPFVNSCLFLMGFSAGSLTGLAFWAAKTIPPEPKREEFVGAPLPDSPFGREQFPEEDY